MTSNELSPKTVEYLEAQSKGRGRRRAMTVLLSASLVFVIGAGAYFGHGVWEKHQAEQKRKREEALAAELARDFRPENFEKARQAIESGQVTREQVWEARRAEFEKMEQERMDAYFALPADQRDAYLDKLIDEMQQRMREFRPDRDRRPQTQPTTGPTTEPTTQPERDRREQMSPEERAQRQQERMDSQSPADRARRAEFRAAMMKRMQERGMNFGRGRGGGGRGGPGR